ncbi:MAG: putative cupredoxin-like copper-binding protein [Gammaproteobacteria bacterium]|jgi:uncharacterized cupredoxin-like copper-binding protein
MKKTTKQVLGNFLAAIVLVMPISTYATGDHDGDHGAKPVFDPVENEFGMYKPKLHITRTIKVKMSDQMRFTPDVIRVKKGDVIKFVHANAGQIMHEFVLGTSDSLVEHAAMMKKFPGMEHSEPYMTHVAPGKKGEIIWKFSEAGEFAFGCLIPGHFDAGMKGTVIVES